MVRFMAVILGVVGLAGCCTEAGCLGTLGVDLTGLPAGGLVQVDVGIGPTTTSCQLDLDAGTGTCDDGSAVAIVDGVATLDVVTQSGAGDEDHVQLTATIDGVAVVDDAIDPGWGEPYYPNGKRCGGACVSGWVSADLGG